jgi:transposase
MRLWRMRTGISITVTPSDRLRLEALVRDRNAPQKQVWRAEIVLLSADGVGTNEIKRRTGKSKTCVWRWQERFTQEGFEGLLRDKTRPPRVAPLGAEVAARVVALTQTDPPAEVTHRLHMLHRWRIRYFDPGAIIAAFCSQGPGFRMSPETLPAASLTKAIRV